MVKKKLYVLLMVAVAFSLAVYGAGIAIAATEQTPQGDVVITGDVLSIAQTGVSVTGETLTGSDISTTGDLGTLTSIDARGTGAGWTVTVASTDFVENTVATHTIDITYSAANGTDFKVSSAPDVTTVYGNTAPTPGSGYLDGGGITLLSAAAGDGMGNYTCAPALYLGIPGETYAGTYTATITETIASL